MKTLKVLMILLSVVSYSQQRVRLADLAGTEIGILIDVQQDNTFTQYFVFQYEGSLFDVSRASNITLVSSTDKTVKISFGGKVYAFTIDSNYTNANEQIYYGYGLSKRSGAFKLVIPVGDISTLMEAITFNNSFAGRLTCHSGGVGSTECSTGSLGSSCSVSCGSGYYACCDDTKNECRCISTKPTKKKPLVISPA